MDAGEHSTTTDTNGDYSLLLTAGEHRIRQESGLDGYQHLITIPVAPSVNVPIGGTVSDWNFGNSEARSLGLFALALADLGVTFSGPIGAEEVLRQQNLFASQTLVPFVEDPNATPVWEFPDGTRLDGFQTLAALSQTSGIPLPTDVISIQTNIGRLEWQLLVSEAPDTVENFLRYVNGGVDDQGYTGTIVHRVEPNFVVQGGGFRPTSLTTTDIDEIRGDYVPALDDTNITFPRSLRSRTSGPESRSNVFGTYAMAKNAAGATSEYFFNLGDNSFLDAQGFTVFAVDLDAHTENGSPNPDATISVIEALGRVDVDPANDTTGGFSVFDNVPFTAADEMVVIESITGSGIVSGTVFDDLDQDGVKDNGEVGLEGVRVFSDANNNGLVDAGEHSTRTDANGNYSLLLTAGEHNLRRESMGDFFQTTPSPLDAHVLRLGIGEQINELHFGVVALTYDFGDAPTALQSGLANDYPVTLAQDGARHVVGDLFFGSLVDREPNGQPDGATGQGDTGGDNKVGDADEDGVFLIADIVASPSTSTLASFRDRRLASWKVGCVDRLQSGW